MNMHAPQSVEAAIELREIAAVAKQMISPRLSKPLVSVVQDTLVGVNRLTRPTEFFTRREFMNLLIHSKRWDGVIPPPAKRDPVPLWSGRQVVSALLPAIFLKMGNKKWKDEMGRDSPEYVVINGGKIEQGILDGDIFDKALIHILYNDFTPEMTVDFIDGLQAVVATYLQDSGFSVGLSDIVADSETLSTISTDMEGLKKRIEALQLQVHMGLFDNTSGRSNQEEFEGKVFQTLDKMVELAGTTGLKSLSANNRMVNMISCGSKGSNVNIAQMIATLGQQSIEGKRIGYGFQDRTLPHFKRYDDGAEARGFIESSFVKGLSPSEFYFHAMTGREGLIDTAVKSVTGDTELIIQENGTYSKIRIGDWIDAQLAERCAEVQHHETAHLELLNLSNDVKIQTCNDNGFISVAAVTAITRHDPGDTLYKIETIGGRSVIVTAAKSLIVFDDATNQFLEKLTTEVRVGDRLPAILHVGETVASRDMIIRITEIDVRPGTEGFAAYPKMYDITVPATLNFALANGLVVRDTADSGYMQRQLVKAMEDLMVFHDGSVRDAGGLVVQFAYGDDGTSATKIENQPIGLGKMSDSELNEQFTVSDAAPEASQAHLAAIFEDRDILVRNVWGGRVDKMVQSAVHLPRLIANAVQQLGLSPSTEGKERVSGAHVLSTIARIIQQTNSNNRLWAALLRYHLNPRDLQGLGFTRAAFDWLAEQIVVKHMKSWVVPGEMAGIIAAQSLGEPTTQMSVSFSTVVTIGKLSGPTGNVTSYFTGKVGSFVDKLMSENAAAVRLTGHGPESKVLDISPEYVIMGVSNDEKTSWKPISQVSRHPANGGLVTVTTKSGRKTTATLTHSFLKRTTTGIAEVKGSDLEIGQRIPVACRIPESPIGLSSFKGFTLNKDFGWLVGIYLADGSFSGNTVKITKIHPIVEERIRALAPTYSWTVTTRHYKGAYGPSKETVIHSKQLKEALLELGGTGSYDKFISSHIFHAKRDFIAGVLSGYFDGDGNVNVTRQQIRVGSRSETLIRDIARLMGYCGVFAAIKQETSIRIPGAIMYTANVIRKHAAQFEKVIGLHLPEKAAALTQIVTYNNRADFHSQKEEFDMIPELGEVIAETGRLLKMPGQSRTYGRWATKTAIGRRTLERYIGDFLEMMKVHVDPAAEMQVKRNIAILESARQADVIWDEIVALDYQDDPHELVYDFTVPGNDSFMVDDNIFVHNTLNSVDWDTEIMIAKDGKIITPRIGEFIDNYMDRCEEERILKMPNDQLYVALDDGHDWKAVSCDENGKMMWTKLEAITKHPVVNDDGTDTILEVTLESGRVVKATKGRSFLTLRDNKIVDMLGSDLKVGDVLPIANDLAMEELGIIDTLELRSILPPTEWLYGTDVAAALATMLAADAAKNRHWFSHTNGVEFTVPYARSDSFRAAFAGLKDAPVVEGVATATKNMHAANVKPGFVYPKKLWTTISQIPDTIPLTREFGFFCGAYVAEGSTSPTQIQITNNDDAFLAPIRTLLDAWEIGHHTVSKEVTIEKTGIKGRTTSLIIHSTLLTAAMKALFGGISYEKTLPDWVLQAPDDFNKGLIDGYFCGDGTVSTRGTIAASSVSEQLMIRMGLLLGRYKIFCTHSSYMPALRKFDSVSRSYSLHILAKYSSVFADLFTMTLKYKQDRIETMKTAVSDRLCRRLEFADTILDRVKSIRDTPPKGGRVYDITVESTRNFLSCSRVILKDTFHLSGVAAKSGMTRGVPRLKELLKVTPNIRASSLTIYLRPDLRTSKEAARKLAQELEFTMLKDLVTVSRIYFDPRDADTLIAEDKEWLSFFADFEQSDAKPGGVKSPWIMRLELNREKMFNKNITMEDVHFMIRKFNGEIDVTYSDHNASRLVFRVRLTASGKELDDLASIKQMQTKLLTSVLVRGLPGLKAVTFRKVSDESYEKNPENDNKYEAKEQYVLDTLGSNFLDVMIHPSVDGQRLLSNHVHDIYENLGIEAARQVLFKEIFTLFEQAAPVNCRHVALLCDAICNRGRMMPADRNGVNKKKSGPLAKASFEQTGEIMLKAAIFGEMDPVTGVSANIMTGQPIRGGTSFTQMLLDESAMKVFINESPVSKRMIERAPTLVQKEIERLLEAEDSAPGCRQQDLRIPAALPSGSVQTGPSELPDMEIVLVDD